MRKRDGATTPPLNPSGNEWIEPSNTYEGCVPGSSLAAPRMGAATVAGDFGTRLLEVDYQHAVSLLGHPSAGNVAGNLVISQKGFTRYDARGLVYAGATNGIRMGRLLV